MNTILISGKYDFFQETMKTILSGILEHQLIDIKYSTASMVIDDEMFIIHSALILHKK